MKEIALTQNKVTIVDDDMFDYLSKWKWFAHKVGYNFYAVRFEKRKIIPMHRFLLNTKDKSMDVDHKDRNGLNNQINNLRIATRGQNMANSRKQKNGTSKFKGVHWHKVANKWSASISPKGKSVYLGLFLNEQDAARAYNIAATKLYGEFAYLNDVS